MSQREFAVFSKENGWLEVTRPQLRLFVEHRSMLIPYWRTQDGAICAFDANSKFGPYLIYRDGSVVKIRSMDSLLPEDDIRFPRLEDCWNV